MIDVLCIFPVISFIYLFITATYILRPRQVLVSHSRCLHTLISFAPTCTHGHGLGHPLGYTGSFKHFKGMLIGVNASA